MDAEITTENIRSMSDFNERMDAARAVAQWELGAPSWAGILIGAFLDPLETMAALRAEKAAE